MDRTEAAAVLDEELQEWRRLSYEDLVEKVEAGLHMVARSGESGTIYNLEIQASWEHGQIQVAGYIDDGDPEEHDTVIRAFSKKPEGAKK
jgi:hypothetical protein